jgi:hypothetical protein
MRIFTILGVIFLVIGVGLAVFSVLPGEGGIMGEVKTMGAGITSFTLIPMGIIFTAIGLAFGRMEGNRKRLLREGVPGQATILSLSGGNLVVNDINYRITFHLRVLVPGRPPYEVDHSQLVPIFALASFPVGATVPVLVDPANPGKLTIDMSGEAVAARQAATVATAVPLQPGMRPVPNTLSTMQAAMPNTISTGAEPMAPAWSPSAMPAGPLPTGPLPAGTMPMTSMVTAGAIGVASMAAVTDQLARMGVRLDPSLFAQGALTLDTTTLDASPGGQAAQATLLANGQPGFAVVRDAHDTGINVHGDEVVELTLDVTPQGGTGYQVRLASLVPAAARARAVPGANVPVRIDPARPNDVVIDWAH